MKAFSERENYLYELAMSVGISTDIGISCTSFADALLKHKSVRYVSIWRTGEGVSSPSGELIYRNMADGFKQEACTVEAIVLQSGFSESYSEIDCCNEPEGCEPGMVMHIFRAGTDTVIFVCADRKFLNCQMYKDLKRVVNKFGIFLYGISAAKKAADEVNARKEAEKKLHEDIRRFREVINGTQDGTWDWDTLTNTVVYGEQWGKMLGYEPEDLTDDLSCWSEKVHPDDMEEVMKQIQTHLAGGTDIYTSEHRLLAKNGEYKWILDRGKAVRDAEGKVIRMVGTHQDIDYRKKLEQRLNQLNDNLEVMVKQRTVELIEANNRLKDEVEKSEKAYAKIKTAQSAMVRQEKMASIGQLASGVAHELNNPLGFITSNFHVLKHHFGNIIKFIKEIEELTGENCQIKSELTGLMDKYMINLAVSDSQAIFDESDEGFVRISAIVDNLLAFARADSGKRRIFNINSAIQSTLAVAKSEIKYVADVNMELGEVPDSEFNVGEINQVLLNILLNAVYAIKAQGRKEQGHICIKTRSDDSGIVLEITDDGPGIPESIQHKVFDIFFTTKPVGEGTGLGLNIVYDIIVNRHGGSIDLFSVPGTTRFTIRIPNM